MKKTISFLLALIMLFLFAACNKPKPVEYHPSGIEGKFLYVNIDGNTYAYERVDENCDDFVRNEWVDSFATETDTGETIYANEWMVFSVEEHPDFECILVISAVGNNCSIYRMSDDIK